MVLGEFTSMSAIYDAMPYSVPRPIAWGTYASIPDVHFFLSDFHDMRDQLPDINVFPAKVADMHRKGTSPNGKFGFSVTTYHGNTPLEHGWADTWEEYINTRTKKLLMLDLIMLITNVRFLCLKRPK
jgi:protein-ribulosamine 3-kinase